MDKRGFTTCAFGGDRRRAFQNIGDTITTTVTVSSFHDARSRLKLASVCANQEGEEVLIGET